MTNATDVHALLLDPGTPLDAGLRSLLALAHERGDSATEDWARRELDGYSDDETLPDYRKISAPIYGAEMQLGSPILHQIGLDELPADRRDQIARLDAALGLHHGVAELEQALTRDGQYLLSPDPVLRPALPEYTKMLTHMPERADGLTFVILYWIISTAQVTAVLTAIRAEAAAKFGALPPPPGASETRTLKKWTIAGVIVAAVVGVALIALAVLAVF
jgi:hypothetical protein